MHNSGEEHKRELPWLGYIALGCGILILIAIIALVGLVLMIGGQVSRVLTSTLNPQPIRRTAPYRFGYSSQAARVSIHLPDSHGTLTYMNCVIVPNPKSSGGGERGLRLTKGNRLIQEWPLVYSCVPLVRVSVYWYPRANGHGPFVRLYDATGESILDLGRSEVGEIYRVNGHIYLGDYQYSDTEFSSGIGTEDDSSGKVLRVLGADGKPARDVTSALDSRRARYLGTIVGSGYKLIFRPSGK